MHIASSSNIGNSIRLLIPLFPNTRLVWGVSLAGPLPTLIRLEPAGTVARDHETGRRRIVYSYRPAVARNGLLLDITECTHPISCMCPLVIRHTLFYALSLNKVLCLMPTLASLDYVSQPRRSVGLFYILPPHRNFAAW